MNKRNFLLPDDLHQRIQEASVAEGKSMGAVVRDVLGEHFGSIDADRGMTWISLQVPRAWFSELKELSGYDGNTPDVLVRTVLGSFLRDNKRTLKP